MKLNELTPVASIKSQMKNLPMLLRSNGFHVIGGGRMSEVWGRDDLHYVVKVFHDDPCYQEFIEFIHQNKGSPYLPKVYGKPLKLPLDNLFGIRIEKLEKMTLTDWEDLGMDAVVWHLNNKEPSYWVDMDLDQFLDQLPITDKKKQELLLHDGFVELLMKLRSYHSNQCNFDLNFENTMLRWKTPVIIDPFFNSYYAVEK